MLERYDVPTAKDTAVCLCYFSAVGYKRPRENFLKIHSMLLKAQIPVFVAECIIGKTPQLNLNPTLLVRSNSAIFHKERLFNLLEPLIPKRFRNLIFMDSDIIFDDPKWVDKISLEMRKYSIVQPFSKVVFTDSNLEVIEENPSCVKFFKVDRCINGHPGFCWAILRSYFKSIGGFFDKAIIGAGDSFFANSVMKITRPFSYGFIYADYIKWRLRTSITPVSINYINMTIYHLYHGDTNARQYTSRHNIPELHRIKHWDQAVYTNKNGMYELRNRDVNNIFYNYFLSRKEDD